MGKLDQYFEQAKALPDDRKAVLEHMLAEFFTPADWELSPEQEAELKKRLAEPNPEYVEMSVIEDMLGRKFRA